MKITLPESWAWARIGEVAEVSGGLTKHNAKRDKAARKVPLVSVAAVQLRGIDTNAIGDIGLLDSDGTKGLLQKNDILLVEGNGSLAHIGRVALWDQDIPEVRHQNHIIRLRYGLGDPRFLMEWLASPAGREAIVGKATTAAGLYTLSLSKVEDLPVPVPPLNEQRRIVAKIEALFERSRRAKEALDAIPPLLDKLRKSILAAAFRGDLTADWRAKHPDVEPASALLDRIRAERRRRWEEAELAKMAAKGSPPKDNKWKAKYVLPSSPVKLSRSSWTLASLEELTDPVRVIRYGILKPGPHIPDGIPYVKVLHMRGDVIAIDDLPRTSQAIFDQFKGAALAKGDLLLSIRGTYGRVALVPDSLSGANITQDSARIAPLPGVSRDFLAIMLRSPQVQTYFDAIAKGVAVRGINIGDVRPCAIPLPPMEEQFEVLERVNKQLSSLKVLEEALDSTKFLLADLSRTVLAKAFRGELVPQDPNDEPASELLKRIRAERQAGNESDKPKRKRRTLSRRPPAQASGVPVHLVARGR